MQHQFQKLAALFAWAAVVVAYPDFSVVARGNVGPVDYTELKQNLSKGALVYFPGSAEFEDLTARWSNASAPVVNIVAVPTTEQDVVNIVKFANKYSVPFLATNGVHGSISSLGNMDNGIEIKLTKLNTIEIAKNGETATIGGGVLSHDLTATLWDAGKQTVTGTCECVSYLGPGLGGGHGWLQGRYGLVSDQYLSMNVVTASGKKIVLDKKSDLLWAMKGAGHNFGIVTSVTSKIYPLKRPNYALMTLFFSGTKVKEVYKTANEQWYAPGKEMPVNLINWDYWFFDPTIDPTGPVVVTYIMQEDATVVDPANYAAFLALGPIMTQAKNGTYRDLGAWTGISLADGPCQISGNANPRFPIYLKSYNPTAQAAVYELFKNATTAPNTPFAGALFMFEGYPQQGVKAIADDATAFAYRKENLLVAPLLTYKPTGPAADAVAYKLGNQIRDVLQAGSGEESLNTYVNYSYGDETPKAWYGADAWRQKKLQSFKKEYDPTGRFSFYAPIA